MVSPDDVEALSSARYALETTLSDSPHQYVGMAGQCLSESCQCKFFIGTSGECRDCNHANLMHLVRPHREDVVAREAEIARSKQLFTKRAAREAREAEKRLAEEMAKPIVIPINTFPCSITDCECVKFTSPNQQLVGTNGDEFMSDLPSPTAASTARLTISTNLDTSLPSLNSARASLTSPGGSSNLSLASLLLPKVCRKCKHAEMYHVKSDDDGKKKAKGAKSPKKKK